MGKLCPATENLLAHGVPHDGASNREQRCDQRPQREVCRAPHWAVADVHQRDDPENQNGKSDDERNWVHNDHNIGHMPKKLRPATCMVS